MSAALPLRAAARELGLRPGTLRRLIRRGAPAAARGSRGRGHACLVDPAAVRAWLGADARNALAMEIATAVPGLLALAADEALRRAEGIDKRALAGILAAHWYASSIEILDRLRATAPTVRELEALPPEIERMLKIARNRAF